MKHHPLVLSVLSALVLAVPAASTTYLVCPDGSGDFLTIKEAIVAAMDGDILELCCDQPFKGEGNRDIDFDGKSITVRSECGDHKRCIIASGGYSIKPHSGSSFHDIHDHGDTFRPTATRQLAKYSGDRAEDTSQPGQRLLDGRKPGSSTVRDDRARLITRVPAPPPFPGSQSTPEEYGANLIITGNVRYSEPGCADGSLYVYKYQNTECIYQAKATQDELPSPPLECTDLPLRRARVELWAESIYGDVFLFATATDPNGNFIFPLNNAPDNPVDLYLAILPCPDGSDDGDACGSLQGVPTPFSVRAGPLPNSVYVTFSSTAYDVCIGTIDWDIIDRRFDHSGADHAYNLLANEAFDHLVNEVSWTNDFGLQLIFPDASTAFSAPPVTVHVAPNDEQDPDVVLRTYGLFVLYELYEHVFPEFTPACDSHAWGAPSSPGCAMIHGTSAFLQAAIQNDPILEDTPAPGEPPTTSIDIELPDPPVDSEVDEGAVAASLWDMFDPANELLDDMVVDLSLIWNVIDTGNPVDLCAFYEDYVETYGPTQELKDILINHYVTCGPIKYVALGDSYSSGEGAGDYENGTDEPGSPPCPPCPCGRNLCHRSARAYSTLVRTPGHALTVRSLADAGIPGYSFDFIACSGATTQNVKSGGQPPERAPCDHTQMDQPGSPPYIVNEGTEMVTITVGGNDLGFAPILIDCWTPGRGNCRDYTPYCPPSGPCFSTLTYEQLIPGFLNAMKVRLRNLYQEIKARSPDAAVFVLGYPQLVTTDTYCWSVNTLSFDDLLFLREIGVQLNQALMEVTSEIGVHFADGVPNRFTGHEICGIFSDDWIYGLDLLGPRWNNFIKPRSFHPTEEGQAAYADVLNKYLEYIDPDWAPGFYLNGLPRNPNPRSFPPMTAQPVRSTPTLGVLTIEPDAAPPCATDEVYVPGQSIRVFGQGFASNETITVLLASSDGVFVEVLSTPPANADGDLDAIVVIPVQTPAPGAATV